ncbi:MAG: hypothetical protein KC466_04755, partial [Myxococcales bacterium]|nr:hypothetical protein [Myxococcales bacterium]
FAVQLHTAAGDVVYFDDPGCYFEYAAREHPAEHAVYFHELRGDRWLRRAEVAFVRVDRSPMAHHLGAVAAGTAGAISFEAARDQVLRDPPIPAPEGP